MEVDNETIVAALTAQFLEARRNIDAAKAARHPEKFTGSPACAGVARFEKQDRNGRPAERWFYYESGYELNELNELSGGQIPEAQQAKEVAV